MPTPASSPVSHPALEHLSPEEKRALLEKMLRQKAARSTTQFPLGYGQRAQWFLYQMDPASAAYHVMFAARIVSPVDLDALQRSFQRLAERHAVLRTTFALQNGQPVQIVQPQITLPFEILEVPGLDEKALQQQVQQVYRRPFQLEQGLAWRVCVFRRGPHDHILLLTLHHILTDYWSLVLLLSELGSIYPAEASGRAASLPTLPAQYTDFLRWQNEMMQGSTGERLWAYWRQELGGELPVLNLPTDRPRPPVPTSHGATCPFFLTPSLSAQVEALAKTERTTLFTVLLAAYQCLLHRYCGQTDILVGSALSGRTQLEYTGVAGYFANAVVLRGDLSGRPTVREFLNQLRIKVPQALAHQDYPLPLLVERLNLARDPSRSPLFQVTFTLHKSPRPEDEALAALMMGDADTSLDLGGLSLKALPLPQQEGQFDLTLSVIKTGDHFSGALQYNTDLFDAATVERMATHFQVLLSGIVANPDAFIQDLPLLPEEEKGLILEQGNASAPRPLPTCCVHERFALQAARTPQAPALTLGDCSLTYQELNQRANQLAHYLRSQGAGLSTMVGVYLERSLESAIALLAILKCGGVYVPLDPAYPPDRLASLLGDAGLMLIFTERRLADRLPDTAARLICLDEYADAIRHQPVSNPTRLAVPLDLAYMIYTSGSTGKPKGTLVTHEALQAHCSSVQTAFEFTENDRMLHFAAFSFDVSIEQLLVPLLNGAHVVMRGADIWSPRELLHQIQKHSLTVINLTPAYWQQLLPEWSALEIPPLPLRLVILGGEAVRLEAVRQWQQLGLKNVHLLNAYGPTETTITATTYLFPEELTAIHPGQVAPIGRPLPGRRAYILDAGGQLAPIGIPGELCLGGIGVAWGYHQRSELTSKCFCNDPFSNQADARLYHTGDLARRRADGEIEFLGRMDHQVKVRGFRIELGEIESILQQHPAVQQAVVTVREDFQGEKRLVAYVTPRPASIPPSTAHLRAFLKDRLPEYMLPATFTSLATLPLTPTGKLDLLALPRPETEQETDSNYEAARTPTEIRLAEIWAQVLHRERVGIHDNFFELGGDSILAIQVVSRANQAGLPLLLRQFFQCQTIAQLATAVGSASGKTQENVSLEGEAPLSPIQHWFFEQAIPEPQHWNQAVWIEPQAPLDVARFTQALQHVVAHHDAFRLRFEQDAHGWHQYYAPQAGPVTVEWVNLANIPDAERPAARQSAAARLHAGLNLAEGSLVRAAWFHGDPLRPGGCLLAIHHLVVDGVSWRILLEDLQSTYEQLGRGTPVHLPPKSTAFTRWVERLIDTARQPLDLSAWTAEAFTGLGRLPRQTSSSVNTEASAGQVLLHFSPAETEVLLFQAPLAYHLHVDELLLAALAQCLSRWCAAERVLVDLESHGREALFDDIDLARSVGWFTALYPAVLQVNDHQPARLLPAIKEQLRRIPNHGLNYGLERYLSGDSPSSRALQALPQAEVNFNYLGQFYTARGEGGFHLEADSSGLQHSPRATRRHLLEINAGVNDGQLSVTWIYSEQIHSQALIEQWAEEFATALRNLVQHCLSPETGDYTPSDFPLAHLDAGKLEAVADLIGQVDGLGSE